MNARLAVILCGALLLLAALFRSAAAQWESVGGPGACRVRAIAARGDHVFAGTDFGIFVSPDNGVTWAPGGAVDSVALGRASISGFLVGGSDLFAFTGHKALYGPTGTGGLIIGERVVPGRLQPLMRGGTGNFIIGYTREQGHPVCIDMEKFVQRSSGVFGATGTGKSFLTRLVLAGLMHYNKASVFVLDMHNEYGFDDVASDTKKAVTGLKTKFKSRVNVVGLGAGATIRGQVPDFNLEIAMSDISSADIEMLTRELNLKETTPTTLNALWMTFRENWFAAFKGMTRDTTMIEDDKGKKKEVPAEGSVAAWADANGVNVAAAEALHDKLRRLFNKDYIVEKPAADSVAQIIGALEGGRHVVLSFGENESDLDYLLVSNLLTRKIRNAWEHKTNAFRTHGKEEPRQLIIVVEEAHKLLNREMAAQTTFATIARELRKYYVTLLIVDQRPSQIYDEVMSQLGTRISGWLGDEDDIHAVLSGLAGREALRGMLARLQPKEEVLLLGWGVPMPLPVRSRRYDEEFWKELLGWKEKRSKEQNLKELGF
mgnify:CR=1 FL=1